MCMFLFLIKCELCEYINIWRRTGKQIRERWHNQLDPSVKKEEWTTAEDELLLDAHSRLGNRWSLISRLLPGRTGTLRLYCAVRRLARLVLPSLRF